MKLYLRNILIVLTLTLLGTSCLRTNEQAVGYITLNLSTDESVELVSTKGGNEPIFQISIKNALGKVVYSTANHHNLALEPLQLHIGRYTLVATSSMEGSAAFDAPAYSGQTSFTISEDVLLPIDLTCSLTNVKVTTQVSEKIKTNFKEYTLTVSNGEASLIYSSATGTYEKEGFFSVTGTLFWTLKMVNHDDVVYEAESEVYTNVKAKQHYNFAFDLAEQEIFGGGAFEVVVDDSLTDKTYNVVLDFTTMGKPRIYSNTYELTEIFKFGKGEAIDGVIYLNASKGFKHIGLHHISLELSAAGLDRNILLVDATSSTISSLANAGVIAQAIPKGTIDASVDFSTFFAKVPMGLYDIEVEMIDMENNKTVQHIKFEVRPSTPFDSVNPKIFDIWATFAKVSGQWFSAEVPAGLTFQYRKSGQGAWQNVDPVNIKMDVASRTFSTYISGLEPSTNYEFRAVNPENLDVESRSFTTEAASVVPNMGFDQWYKSGAIWYPNADANNFYWDTANKGSDAVGVYPTSPEYSHLAVYGSGKAAAKLESKEVALVGLAAGNIYTGRFIKAITSLANPGAELNWGIPFTSRPLALKGYVDYTPGSINKTKAPYGSMSGKADIAQIQIFITSWTQPFLISTQQKRFVDVNNDPAIIAYGTLDFNATSGYKEFTIPLVYRNTNSRPTYIVIVAAASKYGDYFTGSTSSVLYVDEFSLVYDINELTAEQLEQTNYNK